jgi:hypothetical protein
MLYSRIHVVLAMNRDLLLARGIIHGHLIVSRPFVGIGLETADYLFL